MSKHSRNSDASRAADTALAVISVGLESTVFEAWGEAIRAVRAAFDRTREAWRRHR